jgi:predicted permease
VRQLLAESLLLAALGTAAGLVLSITASHALNSIRLPLPVPIRLHIEPDWRLLGYSMLLAIVCAVLCGLVPALRATNRDVNTGLKIEERQTGSRSPIQRLLVAGQLAVSVLLLIIGFLFLKNLRLAGSMNPGFDVHHTIWAYMRLVPEKYVKKERIDTVVRSALEKLRTLPGVQSAATLRTVPFNDQQTMGIDVRSDTGAPVHITYSNNEVGPDYFKTMDIPLLAGREFLFSDGKNAPGAVIINASFAHRLFGDKSAVGHTIRVHSGPPLTIVGVAKDSKYFTMGEKDRPAMYMSYFQSNDAVINLNFMVQSALPPASLVKIISGALGSVDPTAALEVKPMEKSMALAMLPSQAGAALLGSMGALALLLASVGLYGVLLYSVSRRIREFGLRMALGAMRAAVIRLVLKDTVWMLGGGLVTGLLLAFFATPSLSLFLVPEVGVHDVTTFAFTIGVLAAVAVIASVSPVLRAARVDPAIALRYE